MGRTGTASLPLHGGHVPRWLGERMERLGRVLVEALVLHYGRKEVLRRLAHPFWFQSLGCVMGMDWHSSGITTSVLGALKRGLEPARAELGIHVCGGRGKQSRRTPAELEGVGERTGLDGAALARTSRLVAKVDSAAVQDGFELYLHGFIVTDDGDWCVVQQGMNPALRRARRYHWLSERVASFVEEPHAAIEGTTTGSAIVNLTDKRAAASRDAQLDLVALGPDRIIEHLRMPAHHQVRPSDVSLRRFQATLAAAADRGPRDFAELLLTPGLGARTLEALASVAEVLHGAPFRFADPARFSLAHGGKDGRPFPVATKVYDRTIRVMRDAVDQARLGNQERLEAIRRLDDQARLLEGRVDGPTVDEYIDRELVRSPQYGGRSVLPPPEPSRRAMAGPVALPASPRQLALPFGDGPPA